MFIKLRFSEVLLILFVLVIVKISKILLSFDLMSMDERCLGIVVVMFYGLSGVYFLVIFIFLLVFFKLKLKGMIKKGYSFECNFYNIVYLSYVLIRVFYVRNEYIILVGGSGFVMFVVYNIGVIEIFDIKVKDCLKYVVYFCCIFIIVC